MSENESPEADDLAAWADDDLVRALRAPGSAAELSHEQEYAAAYRDAGPAPAPVPFARRSLRRLGTSGTAVVVAVALSGGVAAAYTGNLPDPVQEIAHSVIGAPAPEPPQARAVTRSPEASPSASTSASVAPSPSGTPSPAAEPSARPTPGTSPGTGAGKGSNPGRSPSATPTSPPAEPPPAEPPPPAAPPAAATISAASRLAPYGGTVTFSTRLTSAAGDPVAGHRVRLQVRGASGWDSVARTVTDGAGNASAVGAPVTGLARYRWRTTGVRSQAWPVRVDAELSAEAVIGDPQTTISGSAVGGNAGDQVLLTTRVRQQVTVVGRARLAGDGTVSFTFRTPARKRTFVVVLLKTRDHTPAKAQVVVIPPSARPAEESGESPTPTP